MQILITGGAGFIGSHLLDRFATTEDQITVLDNLSAGSLSNLDRSLQKENVQFVQGDCTNPRDVRAAIAEADTIVHLAANPEVRIALNDPQTCFRQNVYATHVLLEEVRRTSGRTFIFASTSTVYGDVTIIPTPEDHPTKPISLYGASKLASEALIHAYAHTYDVRAVILRLANVVGPRSHHGVIHDFIAKLTNDPGQLEILGDGTQRKSYLYVDDCIDAMFTALHHTIDPVSVLNVSSEDQISVVDIAQIVVEELDLDDVTFTFTGGVNGGRGWRGDVKNMLLDVRRLKGLGWHWEHTSEAAVRRTIQTLSSLKKQHP